MYLSIVGVRNKIEILEDESSLKVLVSKSDKLWKEKKVRCILYLKQDKFATLQSLSDSLSISPSRLFRWLKQYEKEGIDGFLSKKSRSGKGDSKFITSEIHAGLALRISDTSNPFLGYWDAHKWVQNTYSKDIDYQVVRTYLRNKFDMRVKRPRKSHTHKDPEAITSFLKTSHENGRN